MNIEELKIIAKEMGYKLVKDNPMPKLIPCKCGCNKREHWYGPQKEGLKCIKCGYTVWGKNEREARENWNKEMSS